LTLLEASVAENVGTMLHILQHGIELENVRAPAAAEEYARRLAQHGVPVAALLRAYRLGSARFEEWCLTELGRRTDSASIVSATGMRIAGTLNSYIDRVSEEVVSAYELERRNGSGTRAPPARPGSGPCCGTSSRTWPRPRPSWATGCGSTTSAW
jgi:hypothetical protein